MWTQLPLPPKGHSPTIFSPCLLRPNGRLYQDATWYGGRPWRRPHRARWGPSSLSQTGGAVPTGPQFLAHVSCCQTAGWIKMQLGTEVNLGSGDFVLDGVADPPKSDTPPVFGSCVLWPNGWMDEDATWYQSSPRPRPHCIRRGPSSPRKGHSSPPLFGPCLLWPRLLISATAELLYAIGPLSVLSVCV